MDEIAECSHPKCNLLMSGLQIARLYLLVMCSYGGIRILVIIVGMISIAGYNMHCLVNAMYTSLMKPGFRNLSKYLQFYSELQMLFTMAKLQCTLMFFLMGTGIFMTILANFISIKMFQALPIFVYVIYPALSTVTYFLVGMIIPKASSITDTANILRKQMQTYSGLRKRSFYSKRANALGPVYWCTSLGSYKLFHFHNLTLLMY